jgi:hypothetical protein
MKCTVLLNIRNITNKLVATKWKEHLQSQSQRNIHRIIEHTEEETWCDQEKDHCQQDLAPTGPEQDYRYTFSRLW